MGVKLLIGAVAFGVGMYAGVQLSKWYAQQRITEEGDKFIQKVFGSGYLGSTVKGVFDGGVDLAVN
jgi:hypothetical protein